MGNLHWFWSFIVFTPAMVLGVKIQEFVIHRNGCCVGGESARLHFGISRCELNIFGALGTKESNIKVLRKRKMKGIMRQNALRRRGKKMGGKFKKKQNKKHTKNLGGNTRMKQLSNIMRCKKDKILNTLAYLTALPQIDTKGKNATRSGDHLVAHSVHV